MPERQIAHNGNAARPEKFAEKRLHFGVVSAAFQLPDQHTLDVSQSTRQPQVGQHSIDAIHRLVDVLPEPDSVVDPEVIRSSHERRREREAAAEQDAFPLAAEEYVFKVEAMREKRLAGKHPPAPTIVLERE